MSIGFSPLKVVPRRVFMVHGQPGVGKTHMLGTTVRGTNERLAVLDFKGGTNTLRDLAGVILPDGKPQVIVAKNMTKFTQLWHNIAKVEEYVNKGSVQWVAIDNISDMTAVFMREIRMVEYTTKNGQVSIPSKRQIQDYNICQQWVQDMMGWITSLNCNVVFTAWTKRPKKGESEGIPRTESEGISDLMAGDCDHVFYLKKVMDSGSSDTITVDDSNPVATRRILITDSMEVMARSRGSVLPAAMDPDFRQVVKILAEHGL